MFGVFAVDSLNSMHVFSIFKGVIRGDNYSVDSIVYEMDIVSLAQNYQSEIHDFPVFKVLNLKKKNPTNR